MRDGSETIFLFEAPRLGTFLLIGPKKVSVAIRDATREKEFAPNRIAQFDSQAGDFPANFEDFFGDCFQFLLATVAILTFGVVAGRSGRMLCMKFKVIATNRQLAKISTVCDRKRGEMAAAKAAKTNGA